MKTFIAVLVTVVAVTGFLAGYVPTQRRLTALEARLQELQAKLAEADTSARVHLLYDRFLDLVAVANDEGRHEEAQVLSTQFFDQVRSHATAAGSAETRAVLESILLSRDQVTAALARYDPKVRDLLSEVRKKFRPLLEEASAEAGARAGAAPSAPAATASRK